MLISITEGAGRINEALDWQQQYSQYVKEDDQTTRPCAIAWPSFTAEVAI